MAVAFEGFSIREFTSKMRTTDVVKCWPFNGLTEDLKTEQIQCSLPPMSCPKHRWWFNELELMKSTMVQQNNPQILPQKTNKPSLSDLDLVKEGVVGPVCRSFAVNAHVGSCLSHNSRNELKKKREPKAKAKAKSKMPKKRSIAEIFAVTPEIKGENKAEEDFLASAKKKKKKKKEKIRKFKPQSLMDLSLQVTGSSNKRAGKETTDIVSIQKQKSSTMKSLSAKNRLKTSRSSKLITTCRQWESTTFSIHGILKNQIRDISRQNSSAICNKWGGNQATFNVQQSEKHVKFSGKDGILGPSKNRISSIELSDPYSVKDAWIESDKDLASMDLNGNNEDITAIAVRRTEAQLTFLSPDNNNPEKEKNSLDKCVDLNYSLQSTDNAHLFNQVNSAAMHKPSYSGFPSLLHSTPKEGFSLSVETQALGNVQKVPNTSRNQCNPVRDPISKYAAMSSLDAVHEHQRTLVSCLATNKLKNGRNLFSSKAAPENCDGCVLEDHSFPHPSPKDLTNSMCSLVEWRKQRAVVCRDKVLDEDFIGLPLNSQGELMHLKSTGKAEFNQPNKQSTKMGSSRYLPVDNLVLPISTVGLLNEEERHYVAKVLSKNHLGMLPVQNYSKMNFEAPTSSLLSIAELQNRGNPEDCWQDSLMGKNRSFHLLDSDMKLMNISLSQAGQFKHTQSLPTVRLMGKEFTVGRNHNDMAVCGSNKEVPSFEDGKIWTDKEIIEKHLPSMAVGNSLLKINSQKEWIVHPVQGKSKETATHSLEVPTNPAPRTFLQTKAADPRFAHSNLDWLRHVMLLNSSTLTNENPSAMWHPSVNSFPSPVLINEQPCFPGAESLRMMSRILVPASTSCNDFQQMHWNSAETMHDQSLPSGVQSVFKFPSSPQDWGEYVHSQWFQSSSKNLPQWVLNGKQQEENPIISQPYSDTRASTVSYPYNPDTSNSHMHSISPSSASLFCGPLVPVPPGFKPTSSISANCENRINVQDEMTSKLFCCRKPNHATKEKKRPAARADESTMPMKKREFEIQVNSKSMMALKKRVNCHGFTQCYKGSPELDSYGDEAKDAECSQIEIQKDGLRTSSKDDSFKLDGVVHSGPIKLRAGTKHILKPSPSMDQKNSRPTHSTITSAAETDYGKVQEFQKKPKTIYRF